MKHCYRFLANKKLSPINTTEWNVSGDEFFHLKKVLRLPLGEAVEIFDGKGYCARGSIESFLTDRAVIRISDEIEVKESLENPLSIALGALKPGVIDETLPSLTELGMRQIHIYLQDGLSKNRITEKAKTRWQRIILAAAKQCKTHHLPKIEIWPSLKTLLEHLEEQQVQAFYLDPYATDLYGDTSANSFEPNRAICGIIASEKGFLEKEISLLKTYQALSRRLNTPILRSFSAAIATAALMQHLAP